MKVRPLFDTGQTAIVIGVQWNRLYLGASYEEHPGAHAIVFHLGPLFLHVIRAR